MAGEGQLLRAAREEKKWSLTDTEEITKISVRYIQALEEEEYGILPGTTYVKGYLRTYARQLGLNPDEIIEMYKSTTIQEEPILESPQKLRRLRPYWFRPVVIGSLAVVAMVLIISIASLSPNEKKQVNAPYVPPALPSAPKVEAATPSQAQPSDKAAAPSQGEQSNEVAAAPSLEPEKNGEADAAAFQKGLTAQLVFTQQCWIEVKVDGQPPFQGIFEAGTSKEVKGISKIELLSVGNAGGLSVILNGKAYPNLGTAGQVVRNVILTQDTLNQDTLKSL